MKGDYLEVPTDCPTRERLEWTGDAPVFFQTATYFMNVAPFIRKWLLNLRDTMDENGVPLAVVPDNGVRMLWCSFRIDTKNNTVIILFCGSIMV